MAIWGLMARCRYLGSHSLVLNWPNKSVEIIKVPVSISEFKYRMSEFQDSVMGGRGSVTFSNMVDMLGGIKGDTEESQPLLTDRLLVILRIMKWMTGHIFCYSRIGNCYPKYIQINFSGTHNIFCTFLVFSSHDFCVE